MLQQYSMPEHVSDMKEIQEILKATYKIFGQLDEDLTQLQDNVLIMRSNEAGIARREKIVNITLKDVKTLEDRKYEVLVKWYGGPPYTEKNLRSRLDKLCGAGQYVLEISKREKTLSILLELTSKHKMKTIEDMLEEVVPLNVVIKAGLRYNQHGTLKRFTHAQLKAYAHQALRSEVMP